MAGTVILLQTSSTDGDSAPMESQPSIECIAGLGIKGDRYAIEHAQPRPVSIEGAEFDLGGQYTSEANTHWHLPEVGRQLTLLDSAALQRLAESSGLVLPPDQTRRNVLVSGLDLNALVGHALTVGSVELFVHRLTVPCQNLERRAGLPGLEEALWNDGGLSCEITRSGVIKLGDKIEPVPDSLDRARVSGLKTDGFMLAQ